MKIRQGRRNGHNLYVQFGEEPSDDDVSIGYIRDARIAAWMVRELADNRAANRRLDAVMVDLDAYLIP